MAGISERLRREFEKARISRVISLEAHREGERMGEEIKSVDQLIREGHHPMHALYTNVNNLISLFTEEVTVLPMFQRAYDFFAKAQDMYTPGYPPMSPITVSYYNCWTLYDVPYGKEHETLGACFVALADLLELDALQLEAARNLGASRMGIYEVLGGTDPYFRLRELVTDREVEAMIPTGFKGKPGHLVYLRLLPPIPAGDLPLIGMTTPYVLVGCRAAHWMDYFARHQILPGTVGGAERLHRHLKEGQESFYWSEFAFYGYVNYRSDAIFLAGFPDQPQTQPAHPKFDERTLDLPRAAKQMDWPGA